MSKKLISGTKLSFFGETTKALFVLQTLGEITSLTTISEKDHIPKSIINHQTLGKITFWILISKQEIGKDHFGHVILISKDRFLDFDPK